MRSLKKISRFAWWHELTLLFLLVVLIAVAGTLQPNFLTLKSQLFLSRHLWEIAILALPMTVIIITAGIDLSVGSTMGLCAVAFGTCFQQTESVAASCIVTVLVGTACGAFNGLIISWFCIHPLIMTLATYASFRGIASGVSQGRSYSKFGDAFSKIARSDYFGIPLPAFGFAILAFGFAVLLAKTPTGRFAYAIGQNERVARFSGIPVDRIKFMIYTLSGMLAGLATIIYISRFDTAKADAGRGFELDVITAVVVGGTSIFGGRGSILGTTLGLLLIHETRLFVRSYWQVDELRSIVIGFLLIVSVLVYRLISSNRNQH